MVRLMPWVARAEAAYRAVSRRRNGSPRVVRGASPFIAGEVTLPHLPAPHYQSHGIDLHVLWPGAPFSPTGSTRHAHWFAPGEPTGRGLTWFEFSDAAAAHTASSPAEAASFVVVSLACPVSDALDSPAGVAALAATTTHAAHHPAHPVLAFMQIRRTAHGLLAYAPGGFDVAAAAAMTRVLHRVAIAL